MSLLATHNLVPGEIFGGNCNVDVELRSCCVNASLFSHAGSGQHGGDIYYVSHCERERVTRLMIADVQGHGEVASQVSASIFDFMRQHLNELDSAPLLAQLNERLFELDLRALTTAAAYAFDARQKLLSVARAGHPPAFALHLSAGGTAWSPIVLENHGNDRQMMLGVLPDTHYSSAELSFSAGDRLFLYTDGLTEFPYPEALFGEERLRRLLDDHGRGDTPTIKHAVLNSLARHPQGYSHDDVTFVATEFMYHHPERQEDNHESGHT